MDENIQHICELIAPKLALNIEAFVEWVALNDFDLNQLAILGGQISYGKIDTIEVVMSVMNKIPYKIVEQ